MGDLSISNLGLKSMLGLSNSELTLEKTKTSAKIGTEFQPKRQTSQQKLEGMLKESPLDDRVPTKKSMSKMGFKEAYIDYTKGFGDLEFKFTFLNIKDKFNSTYSQLKGDYYYKALSLTLPHVGGRERISLSLQGELLFTWGNLLYEATS